MKRSADDGARLVFAAGVPLSVFTYGTVPPSGTISQPANAVAAFTLLAPTKKFGLKGNEQVVGVACRRRQRV